MQHVLVRGKQISPNWTQNLFCRTQEWSGHKSGQDTRVVRTLGLIYTVDPDQDSVRWMWSECIWNGIVYDADQDPGLAGLAEA